MEFYPPHTQKKKFSKRRDTGRAHMYLPALVFHAVIGVLLTDELVDSTESLFPVFGRQQSLHNQLGIRIRRFGVFLR